MRREALRERQGPLKERYRADGGSAVRVMRAEGELAPGELECVVGTFLGKVEAGLHEAAGGEGRSACSGEMLLEALVACAGVTIQAVAAAMGIELRGGRLVAEGELDFRGTLGVDRGVPVGLKSIRLGVELETDAAPEQVAKLGELAERYCVVAQTLRQAPALRMEVRGSGNG